jgi:hypothetical protein
MVVTRLTSERLANIRTIYGFQNDTTSTLKNSLVKPFMINVKSDGYLQYLTISAEKQNGYFLITEYIGKQEFDIKEKDILTIEQVEKILECQKILVDKPISLEEMKRKLYFLARKDYMISNHIEKFLSIKGLLLPSTLPEGWMMRKSKAGETYYYDTVNAKTTWIFPTKPSIRKEKVVDDIPSAPAGPTGSQIRTEIVTPVESKSSGTERREKILNEIRSEIIDLKQDLLTTSKIKHLFTQEMSLENLVSEIKKLLQIC